MLALGCHGNEDAESSSVCIFLTTVQTLCSGPGTKPRPLGSYLWGRAVSHSLQTTCHGHRESL